MKGKGEDFALYFLSFPGHLLATVIMFESKLYSLLISSGSHVLKATTFVSIVSEQIWPSIS